MKIGIIGTGSIGQRHAINLIGLGHEVIGYDPQAKTDFKMLPGCEDVLDWAEAIVIASPTEHHLEHLTMALAADKHVFVEKPIANTNPYEVRRQLTNAKFSRQVVMVGYNLRFHACVERTRQWLEDYKIGEPIWAEFCCAQYNNKYTEGVILNWSHEIDLALYLFGPADVLGSCTRIGDKGREDIADIILLHHNGVRSLIHLDYVTTPERRGFFISGVSGSINVNLPSRLIQLSSFDAEQLGGSYGEDYIAEMQAFCNRIEGRQTLGATGEDGLAVLEVCLNAMEEP